VDKLSKSSSDKEINAAIGACIAIEKKKHPEWKPDQRVAACFSMAREKTGKKLGE
jgi:hypothetical protein